MFLGQYRHSLDDKNRLTIPSRFRELLSDGAYVTRGFDRNLMVLTTSAFQKMYDHLNSMNVADQNSRQVRRMILGNAYHLEVDKSGRILISQNLREFINLKAEAVLVGQGDYFEVWAPDLWQKQEKLLDDTDANAQRYSTLNVATR